LDGLPTREATAEVGQLDLRPRVRAATASASSAGRRRTDTATSISVTFRYGSLSDLFPVRFTSFPPFLIV